MISIVKMKFIVEMKKVLVMKNVSKKTMPMGFLLNIVKIGSVS